MYILFFVLKLQLFFTLGTQKLANLYSFSKYLPFMYLYEESNVNDMFWRWGRLLSMTPECTRDFLNK